MLSQNNFPVVGFLPTRRDPENFAGYGSQNNFPVVGFLLREWFDAKFPDYAGSLKITSPWWGFSSEKSDMIDVSQYVSK